MSERLEEQLYAAAQTERTLGHYELEQMLLDAADIITELRNESDCVGMAAYEFGRKDIADENAKLREMVADMWRSAMMYCDFAERCAFADKFVDRMRELGIEVRG